MRSPPDKERGPGRHSPDPTDNASTPTGSIEDTRPKLLGPVARANPDADCVLCELVADTRSEQQALFARRSGLERHVSLARTLDYAGTHLEGDLL
jgi:hypothetical protein